MKRQLYYLLPDIKHTKEVCTDLLKWKIPGNSIHAVMDEKKDIKEINDVHTLKEMDQDENIEFFYWYLNITIFCLAFLSFIGLMIWQPGYYLLIPALVMLACIISDYYFIVEIPHVHWREFKNAIPHGEILLIIDVPKKMMRYVDNIVLRRHPEAHAGGVCWKW